MSTSVRKLFPVWMVLGFSFLAISCQGSNPSQNPGQGPGQGPGEDNDRPPVIISDGSVHLRIVGKDRGNGTNKERGSWKQDSPATNWYHDHQSGPKAKNLIVNVINGTGGTNCSNPEWDFTVREFTVTYTPDSSTPTDKTFKVFIDSQNPSAPNGPGRLMIDAPASIDSAVPFWLNVGSPKDIVKSVAFTVGGATTTCTRTPNTEFQVHIYQTTKF